MVNDNKNLINLAHVAAGFLGWLATYMLFQLLAGHWSLAAQAWGNPLVQNLVPILVGVGVFSALRLNPKVVAFTDDVIAELKKVTWPEPKMTWGLTWRVCIILTIAGLIISTFDIVWAYVINFVIKG